MRLSLAAALFLFLPPLLLALDLNDVNDKALENETKAKEQHKLDCIKDIGVKPLESLRSVKPYYQIFILDLTTPMETFAKIRLLFVQAVCLYAAASNHIRIGYIALVNKHKVSSEPSIPDIREFIGMWTEPDEKLLNGVAKARQETPLTHCEKADLLGHIINRFKRMTKKPFRFLIIDDQKPDDQTNKECDQAFEFGKALWRRNISLDNFILDEVVAREQDHSSGKRFVKEPVFELGSLDDTQAFMAGMQSYVESLQKPEAWSSEALKSMIRDNEMMEKEDYDEPAAKADEVIIEFPDADHLAPFGSEDNMTAPDYGDEEEHDGDDDDGDAFLGAAAGEKKAMALNLTSSSPPPPIVVPLPAAPIIKPAAQQADVIVTTTTVSTTTNTTEAATKDNRNLVWWAILIIVIAALVIAFVLFLVFCCWWDRRKLRGKMDKGVSHASVATARSDMTTPLIGVSSTTKAENSSGSSSKRPLRLTKSNHIAEVSDGGGAPIVEKHLPDPYSPVKYINTPVGMPSEIEMTNTEHVVPPTMDEALNKHVVTPMEKVPELHLDDYGI